jgi:hypothetical protein
VGFNRALELQENDCDHLKTAHKHMTVKPCSREQLLTGTDRVHLPLLQRQWEGGDPLLCVSDATGLERMAVVKADERLRTREQTLVLRCLCHYCEMREQGRCDHVQQADAATRRLGFAPGSIAPLPPLPPMSFSGTLLCALAMSR